MTEHQSSRTLVKSAPELWAECSDAASLARHLGAFGEIRITRLEPESTVAWEGAAASGTVSLEPSGWGTRVTLTMVQDETALPAVVPIDDPSEAATALPEIHVTEPQADAIERQADAGEPLLAAPASEPAPETGQPGAGMLARLRLRWRRAPREAAVPPEEVPRSDAPNAEPEPLPEPPAASSEPEASEATDVAPPGEPGPVLAGEDALAAALDSLGRAHHRPYSRA